VRKNIVKEMLQNRQVVIGTMIALVRTPAIATIVKQVGFTFVVIDLEHSSFSLETMADIAQMARGINLVPIVRVPFTKQKPLSRYLDAGAMGLLLPHVETLDDLEQAVKQIRYFPLGERSISFHNAHTDFHPGQRDETLKRLNEETMLLVQIESEKGANNLENLLATGQVDAVFIGPNDLSQSMGYPGQINHPKVVARIQHIITVCERFNIASGVHTYTPSDTAQWVKRGARIFMFGTDTRFLLQASRHLVELESLLGQS